MDPFIPTAVFPTVPCTVGGTPSPGIIIWGDKLPVGRVGVAYSAFVSRAPNATGNFTATGLPAGLSISTAGIITGTPTVAAFSTATITLTNAVPQAVSVLANFQILPP